MTKIEWAEPPADSRGRSTESKYDSIATALRAKPGKWARVQADAHSPSTAYRIRHGVTASFRPVGAFEAVTRSTAGGFDIYARFVGEQA